jgi:hypothetical protein
MVSTPTQHLRTLTALATQLVKLELMIDTIIVDAEGVAFDSEVRGQRVTRTF